MADPLFYGLFFGLNGTVLAGCATALVVLMRRHAKRKNSAIVEWIKSCGGTELHVAAYTGDLKDAAKALVAGIDPTALDQQGHTALHTAAKYNQVKIIDLLALAVNSVDLKDLVGCTPLHIAAEFGNLKAIRALHAAGAEMGVTNLLGNTALHVAVENKCKSDIVTELITRGIAVNAAGDQGFTPLHTAASKGALALIDTLLQQGAAINAQDRRGRTPLFVAAQQSQAEAVALLLRRGARVASATSTGATALHAAVEADDTRSVRLLLQYGASANAKTLMGSAVMHGVRSIAMLAVLVAAGAETNVTCAQGNTPLHCVAKESSGDALELALLCRNLIARGARVNARNKYGATPLHDAATAVVAAALANAGGDVNARMQDGTTVLQAAVWNRRRDVCAVLVAAGADVQAQGSLGQTALHTCAFVFDELDIPQLLLDSGARTDIRTTRNALLPTHSAALAGNAAVLELLLAHGADPFARDGLGRSTLALARQSHATVQEVVGKYVRGESLPLVVQTCRAPVATVVHRVQQQQAVELERELQQHQQQQQELGDERAAATEEGQERTLSRTASDASVTQQQGQEPLLV